MLNSLLNPIHWCERGFVPDRATRIGMRQLIARRLKDAANLDGEIRTERLQQFISELRDSPIAVHTDDANDQHYEVPADFFKRHLGPQLKYSCCYYPSGTESLALAETKMLELTCQRAQIQDGQRILDLGCGWGSMSLWLARHYPTAQITALSNSSSQRKFIEAQAQHAGIRNLQVVTGNIATFEFDAETLAGGFDRIISVEMFEHMKNYAALLAKLRSWIHADGQLFVHIFAHKLLAYAYQEQGRSDWMTKYFFTGGTMPSETLFYHFQDDFTIDCHWWLSGQHYQKTAEHWLHQLDSADQGIDKILEQAYGSNQAQIWKQRWRMFYLAVAELFGMHNGNEWGVVHYRFKPRNHK